MSFTSFGFSDAGKRRNQNEDSYLCNEAQGLFLVADGIGGHASGATASKLAIDCIEDFIVRSRSGSFLRPAEARKMWTTEQNRLFEAISLANRRIIEVAGKHPESNGMGTTLTGFLVDDRHLSVANVGDSRLYRVRNGELFQITQDHTHVGRMVREGKMTPEEARKHPQRHILTGALGTQEKPVIDVSLAEIAYGDLFLMCSDGLHGMLEDSRILQIIHAHKNTSLNKMGISLVLEANLAGGFDNITVVLVSFYEDA